MLEKINAQCLEVMLKEQSLTLQKSLTLQIIATTKLKELKILANCLYSKLDDWIINGIKFENEEIYNYLNYIKKSVQNQQKSNLKLQEHPPVSLIYKSLNYVTGSPYFFPFCEKKRIDRFLIMEMKGLVEDVKSLTSDEDFIERRLLEEYILRRKTHVETKGWLPEKVMIYL